MLDRTQSLSRKVEHLPTKLSVQSHQLQLTVVFSINCWCLLKNQPENQFSETNGKNQEWTSTRVTTEHNSSNSEITSTTVKRSRLHFDLQTQSGFTLRPSPACSDMKKSARASRMSGSSTSCISQPNLKSRIFHTFPQQNPAQFDQDDVIQIKTLKWFRSG